jgi:hypothetical protein
MSQFEVAYEKWLQTQIEEEQNPRRREILRKGLGHGTIEFLRTIWFPAIGNLEHLMPEFEVRDLSNDYRYLDLAYMPGGVKGCIEIHGYRSHARDVEAWRFKDLCMKQALLSLEGWLFLPVAYLSIKEDPSVCKQLALAFVGKFLSFDTASELNWAEAETIRFARKLIRPFYPRELSEHLRITERHTRSVLHGLVDKKVLAVTSGSKRYRTYQLFQSWLVQDDRVIDECQVFALGWRRGCADVQPVGPIDSRDSIKGRRGVLTETMAFINGNELVVKNVTELRVVILGKADFKAGK